jgi:hypothetical protein
VILLDLVFLFMLPISDLLNWIYYWSGNKAAGNLEMPAFGKNFFAGYLPVALASIIWGIVFISGKTQGFQSEFQSYLRFGAMVAFPTLLYIFFLRPKRIVAAFKSMAD